MHGENRRRLHHLCEQAAEEQDPQRLSDLVNEIEQLLEARQRQPDKETRQATHGNLSQPPESIDTE